MKYLKEHCPQSDLTKSIEEKVAFAQKNSKKQYMTWQQTIDDEKESPWIPFPAALAYPWNRFRKLRKDLL